MPKLKSEKQKFNAAILSYIPLIELYKKKCSKLRDAYKDGL